MRAGVILAFILLASVAQADDAYRPPSGFNGHPWGQPLTEFQNLTLWRAAAAGDARGKMAIFEFRCPQKPCSTDTALINQVPEGRGSYALGEYFMNPDANPWQDEKIALSAITYLFCTNATSWDVPDSVRNSFKLCGSRAFFR